MRQQVSWMGRPLKTLARHELIEARRSCLEEAKYELNYVSGSETARLLNTPPSDDEIRAYLYAYLAPRQRVQSSRRRGNLPRAI